MNTSELYKKSEFLNPAIFYIFNKTITEYDLKEAGFNIIQEFKLLDKSIIQKLKTYDKQKRKYMIGQLQNSHPTLKEDLKSGFTEARRRFFEENGINDNDIISIKKDAIFSTKTCETTQIGEYLLFRPKNEYTSYMRFSKKVEIYYRPDHCDVKGINHDNLKEHEDFMLSFIKKYISKMECDCSENTLDFLRRFLDKYKAMELSVGYYREFNERSMFKNGKEYISDSIDIFRDGSFDIEYNYFNILIPMIKILL